MTAQFMKVPKGKNPGNGVVICRGETHNLWKAPERVDTAYRVLSTLEAQAEGMRMKPGTLSAEQVDRIFQELMEEFGWDSSAVAGQTVRVDGEAVPLKTFVTDYTLTYPVDHPKGKPPFRLDEWV